MRPSAVKTTKTAKSKTHTCWSTKERTKCTRTNPRRWKSKEKYHTSKTRPPWSYTEKSKKPTSSFIYLSFSSAVNMPISSRISSVRFYPKSKVVPLPKMLWSSSWNTACSSRPEMLTSSRWSKASRMRRSISLILRTPWAVRLWMHWSRRSAKKTSSSSFLFNLTLVIVSLP